ncbi:MAG: Ig-like domain-containing protein [Clostridia bacterium]|nr:Ig-like domain-containing protein [Clostridia bacterium]
MKKNKIKNRLISIIASAVMLIGTLPAYAAVPSVEISDPFKYDEAFAFTPANGGGFLAMQMSKSDIEAVQKPYVEYSVYAEDAGEYKIEFKSSPIVSPQYTSPATVTINNAELSGINQVQEIDVNTRVYSAITNLSAGENKIRFTVTGERANGGDENLFGLFHLFYVNVTPNGSKTIVDGNTLVVKAENYETASHSLTQGASATCYGGDYYYTGVIYGSAALTYNVSAENEGFYDMTLYASSIHDWLGKYEILINGTSIGDMKDGGVFASYKKHIGGDNTWMIREFYPVKVQLKKGANSLVIRSYEGGTNSNYGFALDCFKFAPKTKLAFDDLSGNVSGTQYYGGAATQMFNDALYTQTYNLDVPAGTYDMYACAGSSVWTDYLGTLSFKLGDGEYVALTTSNVTKGEAVSDIAGHFKYNEPITLSGNDTLEFACTAAAALGENPNQYVLFDYFELVPRDVAIGKADIAVASNKLACGETMQASSKLYYENGYECGRYAVNSVKYASSNTRVATVDENGLITAMNPGAAEISVTYNDTYTARTTISVYDESGIVPFSTSYDAETGNAVIKLTRVSDGAGDAAVIIGGYNEEGGIPTSLTDVKLESGVSPTRGRVETVRKTVTGDNVRLFIWDSLSGMKPMTDFIELK